MQEKISFCPPASALRDSWGSPRTLHTFANRTSQPTVQNLQKSAIFAIARDYIMKKIILFHPKTQHEKFYSFFWMPYSLIGIGSMFDESFDVIIIDENLNEIVEITKSTLKDVVCVGISSMIGAQITNGLRFAKRVREINPTIPIVWGGHLPTILPELTLDNEYVDIIISGQGEYAFLNYVHSLLNNSKLDIIDGLGYIDVDGNKKINKLNNSISRKKLPKFRWELIDAKKYIRNDKNLGERILNYITSLGCPFPCTFCAEKPMYGNNWYHYSSERIICDLNYLITTYELDAIKFYDANFFANPKVAFNTIHYLNEQHSINWAASGHPKTLNMFNDKDWEVLRQSGCKRLLIGAESGDENALNIVKKQITPDIIISLAQKCTKYHIIGSFTFIVGFPNCDFETELNSTIDLGNKIRVLSKNHEVKIHFYAPFPGTKLYKEAINLGFKEPETLNDWSVYDYYNIETPWIDEKYEKEVHEFNNMNCKYVNL